MRAGSAAGSAAARALAACICLAALAGIGINLGNLLAAGYTPAAAIWRLAGFFTILTNAALAAVYGAAALLGPRLAHPRLFAWATSAIGLVGAVYVLMLRGAEALAGARAAANILLHYASPLLALLHWLLFVRKGRLGWRDPLLWTLFPLAYLPYAIGRGMAEGRYVYPFIDVSQLGAAGVAANCALIGAGFLLAGEALVLLDRLLALRR